MENYYEDTIHLKDMFFYIVKQWKTILIGTIIGLLLGCCFSIYKMYENTPDNVLKKLDRLEADEINENNIIQYADYNSIYDKEIEYSKNSLLMNLNSNAVYTGGLSFSFSALDKDIKSIENYYDSLLDNNMKQLTKLFDDKYDASFIKELINYDFVTDNSNSIKTSSDNYTSGSLNVNIVGADEDFVQKIVNKLHEIILEANKKVLNDYSFVSINEDENSITFGYNSDVSKKQTDKINSRQTLLNNLTNIKSKLSNDELLYYSYYYDYDNSFVDQKLGFSKKWPVLFAIGFGVLVAGYYFLNYLFDERLKNIDLIKEKYKLPILGILNTDNKECKGIDKFIKDLEHRNYNSIGYLQSSLSLLNGKKIMLCSEYNNLKDELTKLDNRLFVSGSLVNDTKSLDELKKTDGVVLVSKLWDTKESDIQRQIDIVNNAGKTILGVIVLE